MKSEKWINLFEIKKDRLPDYLCNSYFFGDLLIIFSIIVTQKRQKKKRKIQ